MADISQRMPERPADAPLKILLLGDASNFHNCLAGGLRSMGHDVTVASDGTRWMDTHRDIDFARRLPGKAGGLLLWLKIKGMLNSRLAGYDVVSVNSTSFAWLRPGRLRKLFDHILARNRHVFVSALGTDSLYVRTCLGADTPLKYSEWRVGGQPTAYARSSQSAADAWLSPALSDLCDYIFAKTEGAVTALYEYDKVCRTVMPDSKVAYGGIPVDTSSVAFSGINGHDGKLRLFLGRHAARTLEKGTDKLCVAAQRVVSAHPDLCQLEIVENLPYDAYLQRLRNADIVLDQLYSYTPATNALLAMAMGKVVVSGGEPEYYDFIGEQDNRPIINAVPDDDDALFRSIEHAVVNRSALVDRGIRSREFVVKHNDVAVVAKRFLDFWKSKF